MGEDEFVDPRQPFDKNGTALVLHLAAFRGDLDPLTQLLADGADPNLADADGITPLLAAVMGDQIETARALLIGGADSKRFNKWGFGPLDTARWRQNAEMVRLLETASAVPPEN